MYLFVLSPGLALTGESDPNSRCPEPDFARDLLSLLVSLAGSAFYYVAADVFVLSFLPLFFLL